MGFTTPLLFSDATRTIDELDDLYGAMQYVEIDTTSLKQTSSVVKESIELTSELLIKACKRCSLIREVYNIIAEADTYQDLAEVALESDIPFEPVDGLNSSWSVRLRQYGAYAKNNEGQRFGKRIRSSLSLEKQAIFSMSTLFEKLEGPVNLKTPARAFYIFEGLQGSSSKVFAIKLATGPKTSTIAPITRICVTRTPLCPVAAFLMCNIARIRPQNTVLDPYAGSCSTLLAATMIESSCKTVGIDIARASQINRDDILEDFAARQLPSPIALVQGDCTQINVRHKARAAIGHEPFDAILADPPYGIREKPSSKPPLVQLVECMAEDRQNNTPLLKTGGRLVCFVPLAVTEELVFYIPNEELLKSAGLKLSGMKEQPLNEILSRWLLVYVSK